MIVILSIVLSLSASVLMAQGLETFANFDYTGTAYVDGVFVGQNGVNWNYFHVTGSVAGVNDNSIEGAGMILRRSEVPSRVFSDPVAGGIGNFSVQMRKAYTSAGDRQVALYINNQWIADSQIFGAPTGADPTVHTFSVNGINISGSVVIEIRHIQGGTVNRQLTIDNISWTAFGGGNPAAATPTFNPPAGLYNTPQSVSISSTTPGASIYYTTDGSIPNTSSAMYSAPITISTTTTLKAIATAAGFEQSNVATAIYSFPITVNNLSALRALPADNSTIYHISSEVIISFMQTFRNQKFVQDNTSSVLIDDFNNVITTQYNIYDGITGLTGRLSEYGGMLQFIPTQNPAPATSTNNTIYPIVVDYDQLINDFETYESRLVKIMGVSFSGTGNFANGIVYPSYDQDSDYGFRTTFYDVDYIGTAIPTTPRNIIGIPNSRVDGAYFTARFLSDFEDPAGGPAIPVFSPPAGYYTSAINVAITSATPGVTIRYTTNGSEPNASSTIYSNPIPISTLTTLKAKSFLGAEMSATATGVYTFPTTVNTLAELRTMPTGPTVYTIASEPKVTFTQTYRNQKFIQDTSGAILIDDPSGIITSPYVIGDGISGLSGTINRYAGTLQFTPIANPGPPSSQGNVIIPMPVYPEALYNNFEFYQSRLIKLSDHVFDTEQSSFANGTVYNTFSANDPSEVWPLRTAFYDVDYIGTTIPQYFNDIVGIATTNADGNYISPRFMSDMTYFGIPAPNVCNAEFVSPNQIHVSWAFAAPEFEEAPRGLIAYMIYRNGVSINGQFTTLPQGSYTDTVTQSGQYVYHVEAMYYGDILSQPSPSATVNAVSNPNDVSALTYSLQASYPLPFSSQSNLRFSIKENTHTKISVYNVKGQLIRVLANAPMTAGNHELVWDAKDSTGKPVAAGVYYYKMQAGSFSATRKTIHVK